MGTGRRKRERERERGDEDDENAAVNGPQAAPYINGRPMRNPRGDRVDFQPLTHSLSAYTALLSRPFRVVRRRPLQGPRPFSLADCLREMPKIRRNKKPPPEGWELIEPTLDEFERKMREGERDVCIQAAIRVG
jgi:G10 protein